VNDDRVVNYRSTLARRQRLNPVHSASPAYHAFCRFYHQALTAITGQVDWDRPHRFVVGVDLDAVTSLEVHAAMVTQRLSLQARLARLDSQEVK
jgi:hypothetical protein